MKNKQEAYREMDMRIGKTLGIIHLERKPVEEYVPKARIEQPLFDDETKEMVKAAVSKTVTAVSEYKIPNLPKLNLQQIISWGVLAAIVVGFIFALKELFK